MVERELWQPNFFRKQLQMVLVGVFGSVKNTAGKEIQVAGVKAIYTHDAMRPFAQLIKVFIPRLVAQEVHPQPWVLHHSPHRLLGLCLQFRAHEDGLHSHLGTQVECPDGILVLIYMREGVVESALAHLPIMFQRSMFSGWNAVPTQDRDVRNCMLLSSRNRANGH